MIVSVKPLKHQAGLNLVELLIAMAIGLFIIGGVVQAVIGAKQTYNAQDEYARLQENGRFALDYLASEVRMAGFTGCGPGALIGNSVESSSWMSEVSGLQGYEGGVNTHPAEFNSPLENTDSMIIRRGQSDGAMVIDDHIASSSQINLSGTHSTPVGSLMVLVEPTCDRIGIFQMSGPNTANANNVVHNTGQSVSPGNCIKTIKPYLTDFDCSSPLLAPSSGSSEAEFSNGARLMRFSVKGFFIADNASGIPSLYQEVVGVSSGALVDREEELVEGIESMQITYGEAMSGQNRPERYVTANLVANWDNVQAVRIELLMRSSQEFLPEPQNLTYNGTTYDNDRFARQIVSSTIKIRNRG